MRRLTHISALLALLALPALTARGELQWHFAASLQTPRMGHCAAAIGGRIYVFGGMAAQRRMEITNSVEIYDSNRDQWTDGEPLPRPLYQATAVVVGQRIYVFGGTTARGPSDLVYAYDPPDDRFAVVGRMPTSRRAMGAVMVGRRVLVTGGIAGRQEYLRSGFWWQPDDTAHWETAPELNSPGAGFGLAYNGVTWAVGGMYFGPLNRVEVLRNGEWEELPRAARLPEPRGELGAAFIYDTLLVVAGGIDPRGPTSEVFGFNTRVSRWLRLPPMADTRISFPLVALDGRLYAIGGSLRGENHMGDLLASVEILAPANVVGDEPQGTVPTRIAAQIWPNPVNGLVNFVIPRGFARLELVDLQGRSVVAAPLAPSGGRWVWNAAQAPAGYYTLLLFTPAGKALPAGGLTVLK